MKKTLLSLAIASLAAGQSVCAAVEKVYNEPDSVYIFSYAHPEDEGRSGLKFAWSPDGDKWLSVSDGFAYLKCDFGRWGAHFNKSEEWEVPHTFPLGVSCHRQYQRPSSAFSRRGLIILFSAPQRPKSHFR